MLYGIFEIAVYLWPISLLLPIHGLVSLTLTFKSVRARYAATLLLPFSFPFILILFGYLFWHTGTRADTPNGPVIGAALLFISQVLISLFLIYRSKGMRWFMTAACLIAIWFGLISWFLAGMALTNVWL